MKVKCDYCGSYISDADSNCPRCGAPNVNAGRTGSGVPRTIEELKAFIARYNIPAEKMRFFIGEDYRQPRAFGIYRDMEGDYVVYKNKSDGSRSVRYKGSDQEYAVNEIYQKLKTEFANRRNAQARAAAQRTSGRSASTIPAGKRNLKGCGTVVTIFAVIITIWIILCTVSAIFSGFHYNSPSTGYYSYNGDTYYNYHDDWYYYSPGYGWYPTDVDSYFSSNYDDYYQSYSYDPNYGTEDFYDSGYYDPYDYDYDWDDDWDSGSDWDDDDDWDWDSGSDWDWDSGSDWDSGTDWDSDW